MLCLSQSMLLKDPSVNKYTVKWFMRELLLFAFIINHPTHPTNIFATFAFID